MLETLLPMDQAPKDGTNFLCLIEYTDQGNAGFRFWEIVRWLVPADYYADDFDGCWTSESWDAVNAAYGSITDGIPNTFRLIGWLPLPPTDLMEARR